jgi:uncharacterized protein YdbL (DUF1318 family)
MKTFSRRIFCLIILSTLLAVPAMADSVESAKERIKERLEQIDQMKSLGQVGENANGYLSARGPLGPRQNSLMEAENADRLVIYTSVAETAGQSVDEVGKQRAVRIAGIARSGVWLQRPDGEWLQKP